MKLIDILARELKEWPEGAESVDQSVVDREVYAYSRDGGGLFYLSETGIFLTVLAEDPENEVTHAEWQAAVDALNKPDAVKWYGVGLPPVGAVCEYTGHKHGLKPGAHVEIINHFNAGSADVAVFIYSQGAGMGRHVAQAIADKFRPIRIPEQIAADERTKAIDDLVKVTCINRGEAARIYDAGYRKQEQP